MKNDNAVSNSKIIINYIIKILYGMLIGIGAVLPGVSGGVLCVIFGIYPVVMELISHPFSRLLEKVKILWPYGVGFVAGFWGIAKILDVVFASYENAAVCLFVGLVLGMLPSLFTFDEHSSGRIKSCISLVISCVAVLFVLLTLHAWQVDVTPNFFWYVVCGAAIAISVIAPGISFSTLLMPLGLYAPLIKGIGDLDLAVIIPAALGAVVTFFALARLISKAFDKYYTISQNAVVGIVIGATAAIIPYSSFLLGLYDTIINLSCIALGIFAAVLISRFNKRYYGIRAKKSNEGSRDTK